MFNTIEIDRNKLTIMGVQFSDLKILESTANAIGSNMFEAYVYFFHFAEGEEDIHKHE